MMPPPNAYLDLLKRLILRLQQRKVDTQILEILLGRFVLMGLIMHQCGLPQHPILQGRVIHWHGESIHHLHGVFGSIQRQVRLDETHFGYGFSLIFTLPRK